MFAFFLYNQIFIKKNHSAIELISTFDENFKMKKFIFLLLFFYSLSLYSQENDYKSIVTFSSLSLIGGRVDLGYIQKLNKDWWLGAEIGYGNGFIGFGNNDLGRKSSIFRFSPEIYYDLDTESKWLHLFSIQYFYSKRTVEKLNSSYLLDGDYYEFSSADLDKTRQGINFNYSFLAKRNGRNFSLMPKVGLGIRYKNAKYSNVVGLQNSDDIIDDFTFGLARPEAGSNLGVNVNFDVKLIYRF